MSINLGQAHYSNPGESLVRGFSTGYGLARQVKGDREQDEIKAGLKKIQQEAPVEQNFDEARGIVKASEASELAEHKRAAAALSDEGTVPLADQLKAVSEQRAALPEVDASIDAAGYEENKQRAADLDKRQQELSAKAGEFQPGEDAIKAKYQPALDQLGTGKKYDFFGMRQDKPFTEDQMAGIRAKESDRLLRGRGLKANNLQEYQAEKAGGMAISKAEKQDRNEAQLATAYGQVESYLTEQQKAKARPDPAVLYGMDRQITKSLIDSGQFDKAAAHRQQSDAKGGLQFLAYADADQGQQAAKLYSLFPNGHDIKDIKPIKDKDGNVTGYNMLELDGKTTQISRNDLVDGIMSVASPETWAKLELDRRKGEDANARLLANINARFDLADQRARDRAMYGAGSSGGTGAAGNKGKAKDDEIVSYLDNASKVYEGAKEMLPEFARAAGANPALWNSADGKADLLDAVNQVKAGKLQPVERIGPDGLFRAAVTLPNRQVVFLDSIPREPADPAEKVRQETELVASLGLLDQKRAVDYDILLNKKKAERDAAIAEREAAIRSGKQYRPKLDAMIAAANEQIPISERLARMGDIARVRQEDAKYRAAQNRPEGKGNGEIQLLDAITKPAGALNDIRKRMQLESNGNYGY